MIYDEPIDGMCPRCQVELRFVKAEYEQGFEFAPAYSICPECDWQPGEQSVHACDFCGDVKETYELVNHDGDEYCAKCHTEQPSYYTQLEAVMKRLEDLCDLQRMGHYRSATHVLREFAEYIQHDGKSDRSVIDEGIRYGVKALQDIRMHKDLTECEDMLDIAYYIDRFLQFDIDVIDEALADLREKWGVVA